MLGKHYLVWSTDAPHKRRQYSVCNCLASQVYSEHLKLIKRYQQQLRKST